MVGGAFDQRESEQFFGCKKPFLPLSARNDILVFESEPLEKDIVIAGSITAKLWISSDRPDTDFTIKLVDVYPPSVDFPQGFSMNISDGILRVRYRNYWEDPELMIPGKIYEIDVEAFPTANRFSAGHKIRIDISSSNYPHFDINHNTGDPEGEGQVMVQALNTVHFDKNRPSHVLLPIVDI
jgi:putative CocE/NonD family hydrolase